MSEEKEPKQVVTMTWKQIIERVDMSPENSDGPDLDEFCEALDIQYDQRPEYDMWKVFAVRVKQHVVFNWYCTDTHVGYNAYSFDGKVVAISYQSARKSDPWYSFINKEAADSIRDFIKTLVVEKEQYSSCDFINMNKEVQFDIDLAPCVLWKQPMIYKGERVELIEKGDFIFFLPPEKRVGRLDSEQILVKYQGEEVVVHLDDVTFLPTLTSKNDESPV